MRKILFNPGLFICYLILICIATYIGVKTHRLPPPPVIDICVNPLDFEKIKSTSVPILVSGVVGDAFLVYLKKIKSEYSVQVMLWGSEVKDFSGASNHLKIIFLDDNKRMQIYSESNLVADIKARTFLNARSFRKESYGDNPIGGGWENNRIVLYEPDCKTPYKSKSRLIDLSKKEMLRYFFTEMFAPLLLVIFALVALPFIVRWTWMIIKEN
jgi:hypothetical protein